MGEAGGMFVNRLRKNARHFRRWAAARGLTAYRVYDRDIPEYPYAIDRYGPCVHVSEYPGRRARREGTLEEIRTEVLEAVRGVLDVAPEQIFTKTHQPQPWGRAQYARVGERGQRLVVEEQGLRFWVNLGDYLDTGLFMDHRLTRARVRDEARGARLLNLFAYTGAFTVYAAAGGARETTSVDLSNTYLSWAEDNLALNGLTSDRHAFIRKDVLEWLRAERERGGQYELVVLDPPSFSTSKRMAGTFNVQRDHVRLLGDVAALLSPGGVLYFSTNYQGFALRVDALGALDGEELTPRSIPEDFQRKEVHRCWRFVRARGRTQPQRESLSPTSSRGYSKGPR